MVWIYAAPIITSMTDKKPIWYLPFKEGIRPPVRTHYILANAKAAISSPRQAADPNPAASLWNHDYLFHKSVML
jgi:hypothetical protein